MRIDFLFVVIFDCGAPQVSKCFLLVLFLSAANGTQHQKNVIFQLKSIKSIPSTYYTHSRTYPCTQCHGSTIRERKIEFYEVCFMTGLYLLRRHTLFIATGLVTENSSIWQNVSSIFINIHM